MRWIVVLALGCGSGQKAASKGDCEPGRCLDDIAQRVHEQRAAARACYDAKPDLPAGRIIINFEIDPTGATTEVSQSVKDDQLQDAEVVACITEVIKGLRFPASKKTTRAYHTFEFAPKRGKS